MTLTLTKTNFTAGELSNDMLGRGDMAAYANGAHRLRNVTIAPIGGVSRRAGLCYVGRAKGKGRLVPFEFNTDQTYLMVFSDQWLDIYADGVFVTGFATPWTLAQLPQIAWTQTADTLLVLHPDVEPRRITRTGHTTWTIKVWSYHQTGERINQPYHKFADDAVTLKPSGTAGTISLTASAAVFMPAHVGKRFRLQNREIEITSVISATLANAVTKENLVNANAHVDWEEQAFSSLRGWPVSACFHQDRLVIGGSRDLPNRLWMSKSSDLFNFDLGTGLDDEAIEFAMLSDQVNAIRAVFSGRHLQVFTSGAEWMVTGDPLTPANLQVLRQTRIGSPINRSVPPVDVDGATLFVARNDKDLREFLYADVEQAYQSTDMALFAKHLINAPQASAYDGNKRLFYMVLGDGTLACLTIYRTEKVTAWTAHETMGRALSVAVVEGVVYLLVERQNGVMIECFDDRVYLDCARTFQIIDGDQVTGLEDFEGQIVKVLTQDGAVENHLVENGTLRLDHPALAGWVGLGYSHEIVPLPPVVHNAQGGLGPGAMVRMIKANFRLLDTQALHLDTGRGLEPVSFRRFGRHGFDQALPLFSGDVQIRAIGWKRDALQPLWRIEQDSPLSSTVLAVATEMKFSG